MKMKASHKTNQGMKMVKLRITSQFSNHLVQQFQASVTNPAINAQAKKLILVCKTIAATIDYKSRVLRGVCLKASSDTVY